MYAAIMMTPGLKLDAPGASDGVQRGDVHVVDESKSSRSNGSQSTSKGMTRDEELPVLAILVVEPFNGLVHPNSSPDRVHPVIKALAKHRH